MNPNYPQSLVLGIHAITRGFGWAAFTGPLALWNAGTIRIPEYSNERTLRRVEKLLERLRPELLVLEAYELPAKERSERMTLLYRAIAATARDLGIDVAILPRSDVQAVFMRVGAKTRHEIAGAVARQVPALQYLLPRRRRSWEVEELNTALFCAAALVLAHYALDATRLLDGLRDAA